MGHSGVCPWCKSPAPSSQASTILQGCSCRENGCNVTRAPSHNHGWKGVEILTHSSQEMMGEMKRKGSWWLPASLGPLAVRGGPPKTVKDARCPTACFHCIHTAYWSLRVKDGADGNPAERPSRRESTAESGWRRGDLLWKVRSIYSPCGKLPPHFHHGPRRGPMIGRRWNKPTARHTGGGPGAHDLQRKGGRMVETRSRPGVCAVRWRSTLHPQRTFGVRIPLIYVVAVKNLSTTRKPKRIQQFSVGTGRGVSRPPR